MFRRFSTLVFVSFVVFGMTISCRSPTWMLTEKGCQTLSTERLLDGKNQEFSLPVSNDLLSNPPLMLSNIDQISLLGSIHINGKVTDIAFANDREHMAVATDTGLQIWNWRLGIGQSQKLIKLAGQRFPPNVNQVDISSNSQYIAYGNRNAIEIWTLADKKFICRTTDASDRITQITFSPDEKLLATTSWDGGARVYDVKTGKRVFRKEYRFAEDAIFTVDGDYLVINATNKEGNSVDFWSTNDFAFLRSQFANKIARRRLAPVPLLSNSLVAVGNWEISIVDVATDFTTHVVPHQSESVFEQFTFDNTGTLLVTDSDDDTVRFFDWQNDKLLHEFELSGTVTSLVFEPKNSLLVIGTEEGDLQFWGVKQ